MHRIAAIATIGLLLVVAACTGGDDHTGFTCSSTSTVVFDSDNCRKRVSDSKCVDGGPETRTQPDGGSPMLCCNYTSCPKDPFPELHKGE